MKTRMRRHKLKVGLLNGAKPVVGFLAMVWALDVGAMGQVATDGSSTATSDEVTVRWEGDEAVYETGPWQLRIMYLLKGTRSEGQVGALLRDGQAVDPQPDDPSCPTPFGMLKHYGTARPLDWSVSGWNFSEKRQIRRSEEVQVTPPAGAPEVIRIGPSEGADAVTLRIGQVVQVVLKEQAGTAYHWSLADEKPPAGLRLDGRAAEEPSGEKPQLLGGPVTVHFDFTAVSAGTYPLRFVLRRPFEKDAPAEEECDVNVTVE